MAVKFVPKRYSPGEIEALKKNPNVLEVRENRLLLTMEARAVNCQKDAGGKRI